MKRKDELLPNDSDIDMICDKCGKWINGNRPKHKGDYYYLTKHSEILCVKCYKKKYPQNENERIKKCTWK